MRKFYVTEWFGIKFSSFTKTDSKRVAKASFYETFYNELYDKFSSFEDLPADWKADKKQVADFILRLTGEKHRILSIGCGNGYIEYLLRKAGQDIVAIEPSSAATKFLRRESDLDLHSGFFPQCLKDISNSSFDLVCAIAIDYVFNDKELAQLLLNIRDCKMKAFLLVSCTVYNKKSLIRSLKDVTKSALSFLGLYDLGQFWGYMRTPEELLQALEKANFLDIESGFLSNNNFWIRGH